MERDYVDKQVDAKILSINNNENIYDVGTVINVKDFIVEVAGMVDVMFYEKINIANKAFGYVIAINESTINVAILKIDSPINVGDMAYSTNTLYQGSFSKSSMGRIIDIFGEDKISSKKFSDLIDIPIERKTIPIMDRTAVNRPLLTGIGGIDLMYPIGKGQRQLIIGDKRTGKTQIGLDAIVNQKDKNVLCFYVAIGKTKKEVKNIYSELAKRGALAYTTIITAFNDELPPVISLIPYFALSVAEDYMMEGYDILVVIDDLKRHAEAYREISLISGKTPGRDAYPADIFYTHSRLLEKGCQHKNGGSITILPIVETKGGDITDYISTNIISITDGQIVLSAKSFQKGDKPAIDYGLSVSRLGGAVQEKDMKAVGSVIRRKLLSYLETRHVYELVNTDEMSIELKNQFMEGKFILDNLNQYKFSAKTPNEIIASFSELLNDESSQVKNVIQNTNVTVQEAPQAQNIVVENYNQSVQQTSIPQVSVENNIPAATNIVENNVPVINQAPQVVESTPIVVNTPQMSVESAPVITENDPVMVQAVPEIVETLENTQILELPVEEEVL
ncbi:MAG: F0F1 ATP synthase subunit alpha [Bacilli bacterium]|nr:F0F1 ATP synthase subunit alpha [Bacilli bacterium]